jgi:hypothetical protein
MPLQMLPMHSRESIAWALSVVHSRSFIQASTHLVVPGIDMANHTHDPSAQVRCVYSPDTCQGADAAEEVAPPHPGAAPSCFELVAGEDGLR